MSCLQYLWAATVLIKGVTPPFSDRYDLLHRIPRAERMEPKLDSMFCEPTAWESVQPK